MNHSFACCTLTSSFFFHTDLVYLFTDKPEIIVYPENQTKAEGDNVTLSCNATGNPVPTISWTTNGSPIKITGNSSISFSEDKKQLNIVNVSRTDSGEYRCVAINELGNDTSSVTTLNVQCKLTTWEGAIRELCCFEGHSLL